MLIKRMTRGWNLTFIIVFGTCWESDGNAWLFECFHPNLKILKKFFLKLISLKTSRSIPSVPCYRQHEKKTKCNSTSKCKTTSSSIIDRSAEEIVFLFNRICTNHRWSSLTLHHRGIARETHCTEEKIWEIIIKTE